jgi:hypothetical protein
MSVEVTMHMMQVLSIMFGTQKVFNKYLLLVVTLLFHGPLLAFSVTGT